MTAPAFELIGIRKRFGPLEALRGASLAVAPGEIHALLGENGAGKTTLMRIAYGLARADAGTIRVSGESVEIRSPRDARGLGIGMVHQHSTAVPALSVAENVALTAGWRVRPAEIRERVLETCRAAGLALDPDTFAGRLPVALKQRLEIVKALAADAHILLLDEPTAVLAPAESDELLRVVRAFVGRGNAAVLITHRLAEALAVADRVTVLRRGVVTATGAARGETAESLTRAMVGAETAAALAGRARRRMPVESPVTRIRADALDVAREGRYGLAVRGAALGVATGEIVGIAAVEGNGQRELLRAVAGLIPPLRGVLEVTRPTAFIPEDRTTEGLIPELTLTENVVLGLGRGAPWVRGARVDWGEARARTAELIERFGVDASGPDAEAATLSGGNQQKVVVARALEGAPPVIVAEDPTRGLDVAAASEVHRRLRDAADGGAAVLLHSSDLDEVLERSDRILVVSNGRVHAAPPGAGREAVGAMMLGTS